MKALEEMGFVYRNKSSRWLSPVPKPKKYPGQFRMVIDCRYANSQVQPMAGFLPFLEVSMRYFEDSGFGSLDGFKIFWQFQLDSEIQQIYSFLTEYGVYTPTRLIQGRTDSVHSWNDGSFRRHGVGVTTDFDGRRTTDFKDFRRPSSSLETIFPVLKEIQCQLES